VSGADPSVPGAAEIVERALDAEHDTLLEHEGYAVLAALGVATPPVQFVTDADQAAWLAPAVSGTSAVVKVASRTLTHKTDIAGVVVVEAQPAAVRAAVAAMQRRLAKLRVEGYLVCGHVPHSLEFGAELLVSLRQTDDFGPVVTMGAGGVHTELLAASLRPGADVAMFDANMPMAAVRSRLLALPVTRVACGAARGAARLVDVAALADLVHRLLVFGASPTGARIAELEINPLALTPTGPVALDVVVRLRAIAAPSAAPRPVDKLTALLRPSSIAIVGVSEGMNAGRRILRNVLHEGFPADRIAVVKAGSDRVDGVECYPDLAALPEPVDLCVLAVAAAQIPGLLADIVNHRRAESVIVIPGGLGERAGTRDLEEAVRVLLARARATSWRGPLINGGNCLGIRSVPGRYDTTFIPRYKLGGGDGPAAPLALIAQSGAFAVARWSKLAGHAPRYLVSVGNQTDLTVGDYLAHLADDPEVGVFACYVEGFRPDDGTRWLAAARHIVASGRSVLLYRAARTVAGRAAGLSHTAAIAGDYAVTRELATAAGVLVADTLDEFDDLLRVTTLLADRPLAGSRLGAVSNAGFECVALGDGMGTLRFAQLAPATEAALADVLRRQRLDGVVDVRQPLDVTPMLNDAGLAEATAALLGDVGVDVVVVGIVPLTPALQTLPFDPRHRERLDAADGIVARLAALRREGGKPLIAVVDAGAAYDPLAARLEAVGIPAFRAMDRALRTLGRLVPRPMPAPAPVGAPVLAGAAT
jgi:acyl-CoA synthetase (NDP forming)